MRMRTQGSNGATAVVVYELPVEFAACTVYVFLRFITASPCCSASALYQNPVSSRQGQAVLAHLNWDQALVTQTRITF